MIGVQITGHMTKVFQPAGMYMPFSNGRNERAVRFVVVAAVAESTAPDKGLELAETVLQLPDIHVAQAKTANAGGVDKLTALWQTV